ncbi:MAG TPA: aminotransferase class V-fold PLP-dependent enzyme [Candidatus Anoxymicrobiaceae bacterium]
MRSVYLDNAATTYPKPEAVYQAAESFMRDLGGSAGRSGHARAVDTGRLVYAARAGIAAMIGADDPLRVVFTKNATEALNLAIRGLVSPGDHVVTSSMEHNSVMRPLEALRATGVSYTIVRCAKDGTLDPADLEKAITPDTRLVVLNHASNVTGTILPIGEVAAIARARGLKLLVDAAQTVGRLNIDVSQGFDLVAFSGHKELFGLQGTGGLYIREGIEIDPLCYGGTGSKSSELQQPEELPDRFESGTLNAHGIVGLGAGVKFVTSTGIDAIRDHEVALLEVLCEGLGRIKGVTVHGPASQRARIGIVPLTFEGISTTDAAEVLDARYGIATRAGLHCAPAAHQTIGTFETGALRVSVSYLNTEEDVEYFLNCLEAITG